MAKANKFFKVYENWMSLIGEHQLESGKTVKVTFLTIGILAVISNWENQDCKCYMTNKQLADYFGVGERTISNNISVLRKLGLIKSKMIPQNAIPRYRQLTTIKQDNS